ncbi:DUF2911 domain-containing protein [Flavobacteriaceae bacterium]|nr:DUF2911 domain-containing protein [Flavobacteriaceae bacterium]
MKKFLLYSLLSIVILLIGGFIYVTITPPASPLDTSLFNEDGKEISITYSKPYKKGRLIFGDKSEGALVPFNQYWRTGANRHTIINTTSELIFSDNILPSGEYSLYTIPGKDKWEVVINSENGYFGIVQPDESNDLFSFEAFPTNLNESVEQLTIDFVSDSIGSSVRLRWDLTEVLMPFK